MATPNAPTTMRITSTTLPSDEQTVTQVVLIRPPNMYFRVKCTNGVDLTDRYMHINAKTGTLSVRVEHIDGNVVAYIVGHAEIQSYSDGMFNTSCIDEITVLFL